MIKKVLRGYDMALAWKYYRKGDLTAARGCLDRYFRRDNDRDAVAIAFDATILVLEGKSERAAKRFAESRALAGQKLSDSDATYVKEYCLYYECLIANRSDCDLHKNAALEVMGSPKVLRWLSLPVGDF